MKYFLSNGSHMLWTIWSIQILYHHSGLFSSPSLSVWHRWTRGENVWGQHVYPCATVTWDQIRTRAAVAGQTQSIAKTDLCLKITPAKPKALPLPAQLCIISRLWCFKHASSPGQVTDHLMLPGQARPPLSYTFVLSRC